MTERRVVITGIGVVCPLGNTRDDFWQGPLVTADVTVKETRSESFAILSSKLSDRMSLESALFAEYSVLRQIAPGSTTSRNFFFLRPSLDFRFNITSADQFQLSARRTIGQLDFSDFVTSVERDDDKVFEGNVDLVQEKSWQFESSYEHRFKADAGFIKVRLFYEAFQDKVEFVEISPLVSGVGNIGNATKYGVQVQANIRLVALGMRDAVIEGDFTLSDSSVTDPFEEGRLSAVFLRRRRDWTFGALPGIQNQ